jgi:hypothetical protein
MSYNECMASARRAVTKDGKGPYTCFPERFDPRRTPAVSIGTQQSCAPAWIFWSMDAKTHEWQPILGTGHNQCLNAMKGSGDAEKSTCFPDTFDPRERR